MFKRVALPVAAAAVLMTSGAAGAADFGAPPLRGSEDVAVYERTDKWSGLYVGGHVGMQIIRNTGHHSNGTNGPISDGGVPPSLVYNFSYDYAQAKINYGLHIGIQRLFGQFLIGAEFDFDGPSGKATSPWYNGHVAFSGGVAGNSYQQRVGFNWQGSLRARAGFVHHKSLFYLTGGLAFGGVTVCTVIDDCINGANHVVRYTRTRIGWTIGGGIEHKFNYNWSMRAEYRYTNWGSRNCFSGDSCSINVDASDIANRVESHMVRVGVSYLFCGPAMAAPIMARY
jgi:outer membrane immunogenic protein